MTKTLEQIDAKEVRRLRTNGLLEKLTRAKHFTVEVLHLGHYSPDMVNLEEQLAKVAPANADSYSFHDWKLVEHSCGNKGSSKTYTGRFPVAFYKRLD